MAEAESSILIVDDDNEDLSALEKALDSLGCDLHKVTDPHDVLPAVYRDRPDVVVLDALLPGLSGFDLCKQIKTDAELKGTQVVIITGVYLRQQYRHEALQQFKADGFLTKPFRPPELQRLVVELLAKKTRRPQSSFLSRLGLPAASSSKKRGLFGRLFGKEEAAPARIAPVSRARPSEAPPSKTAEAVEAQAEESESAPVPESTAVSLPESWEATTPSTAEAGNDESAEDAGREEQPAEAVVEETKVTSEAVAAADPGTAEEDASPEPDAAEAAADERAEAKPESAKTEAEVEAHATKKVEEDAPAEAESPPEDVAVTRAAEERPPEEEAANADGAPAPDEEPVSTTSGSVTREEVEADEPTEQEPPTDVAPSVEERGTPASSADEHALDAPASEEGVEWSVEKSTPAASEAPPASTVETPAESDASEAEAEPQEVAEEDDAPAKEELQTTLPTSPLVRRAERRIGEVPIYDEEDFKLELKRELSKCRRVDRPLTLILIRVHDLSQIVEMFGKEIRDPVLWYLVEQAVASLREVDLVGMMSSEDLIALTAFASDKYGGGRVVTRVRKSLRKNPFRVGEELPPIVPALRFGMSSYPDDGDDVDALIAKASKDIDD